MRVMLAASEALPFVKTGGLADVLGALPRALQTPAACGRHPLSKGGLGMEAAVIMPLHKSFKASIESMLTSVCETYIYLGWRRVYLGVLTLVRDGVTYFFIDNEDYFGDAIYRGGDREIEQYLFFCRAVLAAVDYIDFKPDIIHCNDWHTGMIPMLIKTQYRGKPQGGIKTVFTIHNLKFQGQADFSLIADYLSIPRRYNTPEFIEAHGCANMMKAALVFADKITTVSPTFAEEAKRDYFGMGMEGILRARSKDFIGILNGIDAIEFDPETDKAITKNYNYANHITGKRENKAALTAEFNMDISADTPLIAVVSRLTEQKGIDLIRYFLEELLQSDVGFVLLGSGEPQYHDFFNYIAGKYPGKTGVYIGYNESLSRRIYAGADFLLMPSQFEPCGLSQMIAQRYGALPIVRETGGLKDTVVPLNEYTEEGDGFSFAPYNANDCLNVIRLALSTYNNKKLMRKLVNTAMQKNNSFTESAKKYMEIYDLLSGKEPE